MGQEIITLETMAQNLLCTHWYADDLLKQCPSKGDKYVIDE
jgi:hypothetical protein